MWRQSLAPIRRTSVNSEAYQGNFDENVLKHNLPRSFTQLITSRVRAASRPAFLIEFMSNPAIQVRNLKKAFKKRKGFLKSEVSEEMALDGVSFEMARGEIYGLLGPNGSGKSTLIRILSTLLTPDEGYVSVLSHPLPQEEREVRWKIGRVSADAAFYKKLSARENLLYTARLYGLNTKSAERRAMAILERLGMESRKFSEPLEEMSRGMQQKIAITRALLINPPLLLLDEPTTGLDPKSRRDVHEFLEQLKREQGTTILLTTHDMIEAERLSDRIGFLSKGKLVAEGTALALREQACASTLEDAFIALSGARLAEPEVKTMEEA